MLVVVDPIAGIVVTLGLLAVFIGVLVAFSARRRAHRLQDRQAIAAAAVARGWAYNEQDGALAHVFSVKPFQRGARKRPTALDVVSGSLNGHPAIAFRHRYVRSTDSDTLADTYAWHAVCAVQLPAEYADLPAERKSFTVDGASAMARQMVSARGTNWAIDGNWLLCWSKGERIAPEVIFNRLELLAAIVDGRDGRVVVQ